MPHICIDFATATCYPARLPAAKPDRSLKTSAKHTQKSLPHSRNERVAMNSPLSTPPGSALFRREACPRRPQSRSQRPEMWRNRFATSGFVANCRLIRCPNEVLPLKTPRSLASSAVPVARINPCGTTLWANWRRACELSLAGPLAFFRT